MVNVTFFSDQLNVCLILLVLVIILMRFIILLVLVIILKQFIV